MGDRLEVVLFTGGRGSQVLSRRLLGHQDVHLVLAVNGYDDGASTGEVRRYLGDALGPSDFRKNAARVAEATASCARPLLNLLDARLPAGASSAAALDALSSVADGSVPTLLGAPAAGLEDADVRRIGPPLRAFLDDYRSTRRGFKFADCAIGNLVFAGCYLVAGRRFNGAVDDYAAILNLRPGTIDNVTDGTNAHLVAIDTRGTVLGTEEAIVGSHHGNGIAEIFLLDGPIEPDEQYELSERGPDYARAYLESRTAVIALNPRLAHAIDVADVIIYAPGTQHSSLFPSYLTPGLADRIARNVQAVKLLVTNLEVDREIAGESAVSLVERALFYLTDKGRHPQPAPCLITHYLLNDPGRASDVRPYVPLGQVDTLEDPRLVRIGAFEDGVTGFHDAAKVLEPFIESRLDRPARPRVGILMYGATSVNKLAQSLLEMTRVASDEDAELSVFVPAASGLDAEFLSRLNFAVRLFASEQEAEEALRDAVLSGGLDYVGLFESSGMYRGEDLTALCHHLQGGRLDAVWGSRRLSVRDIREAYRTGYANLAARETSRVGSHLLSLAYLLLYGRYVSDTLSGVRLIRASATLPLQGPWSHPLTNQYVLAGLLRRQADLIEVPVHYLPVKKSGKSRRLGVLHGLAAMILIIANKFAPLAELPPIFP